MKKETWLCVVWILGMVITTSGALFNLYVLVVDRSLTINPWLNVGCFLMCAQFPATQIMKLIKFHKLKGGESDEEVETNGVE